MSRSSNSFADTRAANFIAHHLTHAAAWVLGHFRTLERHRMPPDECAAAGLPEGFTVPAVSLQRIRNGAWWRLDAWDDGAGCFTLRVLGYWGEVFYEVEQRQSEATA